MEKDKVITSGCVKADVSTHQPITKAYMNHCSSLKHQTLLKLKTVKITLTKANKKGNPTYSPHPISLSWRRRKKRTPLVHDANSDDDEYDLVQDYLQCLKIQVCWDSTKYYQYGPDKEERTCILSGGDTFSWKEESSRTSWIAVIGTKTVSLVSMPTRPDHDKERPYNSDDKLPPTLRFTMKKVFYELAEKSTETRQRIARSSKTEGLFAVVCVAPGSFEDHHESGFPEVSGAVDFLKEKLKNYSTLSLDETEQIAVCALRYLFGLKFKSDDIQLCGSGNWDGAVNKICPRRVGEHLAVINEITRQ